VIVRCYFFLPWPEKNLYEDGWKVFGLYAFGKRVEANCALCPATTRLVESVPGMTTAGFSLMAPGTHIRPHEGYTTTVLRCHLGVVVPDGCELRVGDETRAWKNGACMVFDDTFEHEAWNRSDSPRVVLLIDFTRPGMTEKQSERIPDSVRRTVARITGDQEQAR